MKTIVLVGRSGSGKSAIAGILTSRYNMPRIKTCTTRKRRSPDDFYEFLSRNSRRGKTLGTSSSLMLTLEISTALP